MASGAGPRPNPDGLILEFDAANKNSYAGTGSTWYGLISSKNAAFVNSPTYIVRSGGGFDVDGIGTNYFNLDSLVSTINLSAGTVGGWVRFNTAPSNVNYVFVSFGGNAAGGGFLLIYTGLGGLNRGLTFQAFGGTISPNVDVGIDYNSSSIYAGKDIYMIATWTTSEAKFYINGELKATSSNNAALPSQSTFRISSENGRTRGVNGTVYSFILYNRALSAAEILQNYNAAKGRYL